MAILLIVFYILSPLSTYNVQTTFPIYYLSCRRSLYFYIPNPSSKGRPYPSLSLSIQLGRYAAKCLQKFACLFYQTSLTVLLYIYNQSPKSCLDYLLSSLIQIYSGLFYYCPRLYLYCRSILLYQFSPSYLYSFYPYYCSTVLPAPAPIERL